MSKYLAFESEAFANRELLVEALKEMGFGQITEGTDLLLQGWDKRDNRVADVVIRRTIELTWGETDYTQLWVKKTTSITKSLFRPHVQ